MSKLSYGSSDRGISYSRLQSLDTCPRMYQIENIFGYSGSESENNINFAYGHTVATGIQWLILNPTDFNGAIIAATMQWTIPFFLEEYKNKKSIWFAVEIIKRFYKLINSQHSNIFKDFEVVAFVKDGKTISAVELTFAIMLPKEYIYEGHIDLVLRRRNSTVFVVLELKTTGFSNINPASYKNSIQALGYALVLDSIAASYGHDSAYSVFYLVIKSGKFEFEPFVFEKSFKDRIDFLNHLLTKVEILELYRELNYYPSHGQSCFNFFRECKYYHTCKMSDETLEKLGADNRSFALAEEVDFIFTLDEIKETQLALQDKQLIKLKNLEP